jgi:hypothetical protein
MVAASDDQKSGKQGSVVMVCAIRNIKFPFVTIIENQHNFRSYSHLVIVRQQL